MSAFTIEGIVENGEIRLLENLVLPENTKVLVVIPDAAPARQARVYSPRLANKKQSADFVKQVIEAPTDAKL
jgi:hypothetical protein